MEVLDLEPFSACQQIEAIHDPKTQDSLRITYVSVLIRMWSPIAALPDSALSQQDSANLLMLRSGSYRGTIALQSLGFFVGEGYHPSQDHVLWTTIPARYNTFEEPFYWIFERGTGREGMVVPHVSRCLPANERSLSVWDQDTRGETPEDKEMFAFDVVDPHKGHVRLRSLYGPLYLRLNGDKFDLTGDQSTAAILGVSFR
jgi:hypothetical protein